MDLAAMRQPEIVEATWETAWETIWEMLRGWAASLGKEDCRVWHYGGPVAPPWCRVWYRPLDGHHYTGRWRCGYCHSLWPGGYYKCSSCGAVRGVCELCRARRGR